MLDYAEPNEPELLDKFFLSAGKALCIATRFESGCQYVLKVVTLINAHATGEKFDAALELAQKIEGILLNKVIGEIGKDPQVTPADLAVLHAARLARNYVAHECANLMSVSASSRTILSLMEELRKHVEILARGDALVSRWCYEIAEKESAPWAVCDQYEDRLGRWVFGGPPVLDQANLLALLAKQ